MDNQLEKELADKLKKKKLRKYSLLVLFMVVLAYAILNLNIEGKDAKLADGQGKLSAEDLKVDNSEDYTVSNGGNAAYRPDEAEPVTVTISIRCDNLSEDMSKLETPSIADYIPADGCILATTTYEGTTDNTVFDALNTVCRNNDIQLEFSFTPVYESYYIEGINYLYEFDGGSLSGWMYKVNDWFPNYGCSSYYLSDGDVIEWVYTCDLGADVGDTTMSQSSGREGE